METARGAVWLPGVKVRGQEPEGSSVVVVGKQPIKSTAAATADWFV